MDAFIRRFWRDRLVTIPGHEVVGVDTDSVRFLERTGLPLNCDSVSEILGVSYLEFLTYDRLKQVEIESQRYLVFTESYGMGFGLCVFDSSVRLVDLDERSVIEYAAKNTRSFMYILTRMTESVSSFRSSSKFSPEHDANYWKGLIEIYSNTKQMILLDAVESEESWFFDFANIQISECQNNIDLLKIDEY